MPPLSSELLGFPAGARVLIVNNDDFGMYHAVNAAVIHSIEEGIASSCSLMVPGPGAPDAMRRLREHPAVPFGIHLTLVRGTPHSRWGPLAGRDRVPSLLDEAGELYTCDRIPELLAGARAKWNGLSRATPASRSSVSGPGSSASISSVTRSTVARSSRAGPRSRVTRLPA